MAGKTNREAIFNIIYALAAHGGNGALFGTSAPVAREAFSRGLTGESFPELWFELPLAGDPWFDLHMLVSHSDVKPGAAFAGLDGPYANTLAWFAESQDTRQLALSFDTGAGNASEPAIQLLLDRKSLSAAQGFLAAAGRPELAGAYETFIRALPPGWYACYSGIFPARERMGEGPWLRVECLLGAENQRAYVQDANALRADLGKVGMAEVDDELVETVRELARSPFPLEFQFNVGPDGRALPVLSASVHFQPREWKPAGGSEDVRSLFRWLQERGMADGRLEQLPGTAFGKRLKHAGADIHLSCYPAFVKLRWRPGQAPDAKTYLVATAT